MDTRVTVVILAAGLGTRMKSRRAKVLHQAGGKTLIEHTVDTALSLASPERVFVVVGHQADEVRTAVEAHLMAIAGRELPPRCLELAAMHRLGVARIAVRNQKSRWGSCSPRGVITLNWRLIQMPRAVSEYVLLHELMHLRQPNHSRRFWREVEAVCPTWRESERWLRRYGREIL